MQANHDCIDNIIHTKAGVQVRLDCAEIIRQQGRNEGVGKAKKHVDIICQQSI